MQIQRFGLTGSYPLGHGKAGVGHEHLVLIVLNHGKEALVGGVGVVSYIHGRDELLGAVALLEGVVEVHKFAFVGHLEQGIDGFEKYAVAILEYLELGTIYVEALRKGNEGPDSVPQVVCPLGEVSVGRKQHVHLLEESALAA